MSCEKEESSGLDCEVLELNGSEETDEGSEVNDVRNMLKAMDDIRSDEDISEGSAVDYDEECHQIAHEEDMRRNWYWCMDSASNTTDAMKALFECDAEQFYLNGETIRRMLYYRFSVGIKAPEQRSDI